MAGGAQSLRCWLRQRRFVQRALTTPPDPMFRQRPSPKTVVGLVLIAVSYLIAWPAIAALGAVAAWLRKPELLVAGPVLYGLSWLVFAVGVALIGKKSVAAAEALGLTLVRKLAERYLRE